jgi:catechol 2,3-dioxygenase
MAMIATATTIGEVQLFVSSLERSVHFYQDRLGFKLLGQQGSQVSLGAGGQRLVVLNEKPGAKPRSPTGVTGVYHIAVLLPDRRALARLLVHLAEDEMEVQGAADHGVSEAIYLADPDGIGIEMYRDRRRSEWPKDDLGRLQMGTEELDVDDLVMELKNGVPPWDGLPDRTVIGHVHLHVANLAEAEKFYTQVLGFQITTRYSSGAIFVSAGGYHHHIGLNTWAGAGAPPPPPDAAGLRWFEIRLPGAADLQAVQARLEESKISSAKQDGGILVRDPSQNALVLKYSE